MTTLAQATQPVLSHFTADDWIKIIMCVATVLIPALTGLLYAIVKAVQAKAASDVNTQRITNLSNQQAASQLQQTAIAAQMPSTSLPPPAPPLQVRT
jgi:hypothetical protein